MKRCLNCMELFNDELSNCPICGSEIRLEPLEPQYLKPGLLLKNRYIVGNVIGSGGFGITYVAYDTVLQQKVAIKEYLPGEFSTRSSGETKVSIYGGEKTEQFESGRDKFHEESLRLAKLRNVDGIVQIYDSFQENNTAYIVMEYLEGETLDKYLKKKGKLSQEQALTIMIPILNALVLVHEAGILHRDIAPNNIFLCKDGRVKLLDFGAARSVTGTHSKSLTVLYKEGYTPEEQYRSRGDQGAWTDVYSCAATFYKMVTGEVPIGAMERRRKDTLRKPSANGADTDSIVDMAIMNALNVTIENRTQSVERLLAELTGVHKPKKHYVRTIERKIGQIPIVVKVVFGIIFVAIILLMGLLELGIIHFDIVDFGNFLVPSGKARVANIVNMDENDAKKVLENAGLILEIEDIRYSNKINEGRIISQSIDKGTIVDEGTSIKAVVSQGAGIVEMPHLIGQKWSDIQEELDMLCIDYAISEVPSLEAPGYVISQSIEATTKVEQGVCVDVLVSIGNGYEESVVNSVPLLTGEEYESAKAKMADLKLYLQVASYEFNDTAEKGTIISQSQSEGTVLHGGEIVEVVVSLGIEQIEVPNVVGENIDEAIVMLQNSNFSVQQHAVIDESKEEGIILEQSVDAGSLIDKYSEIILEVCSHGIEVPNFVGKTLEEAQSLVRDLEIDIVPTYQFGGNGTIISQSDVGGTVVELGTKVNITIGISQTEFTEELVSLINEQRRRSGYGILELSSAWCQGAQSLANCGYSSADAQKQGIDFSWAAPYPNYGYLFWATRDGISTPENMFSRIINTKIITDRQMTKIGIAYSGNRISITVSYI